MTLRCVSRGLVTLLAVLVAGGLHVPRVQAWEVFCRQEAGSATPISRARIEQSICETDPTPRCEEGLGTPRGIQRGEHTWLTQEAMRATGLHMDLTEGGYAFRTPLFGQAAEPGYFGDASTVLTSSTESIQPAAAGSMRRWVRRAVAIPEFSEVPDGSHSIAEFAMGNEHCVPQSIPKKTLDEINGCHAFKAHAGSINSNHWPPLHRATYDRYHRMALATAARCRRMQNAVVPGLPFADYMEELTKACEREALIYQAYASHFLEDAWATGHMFERWGAPFFQPNDLAKLQNSLGALLTGMVHGARAVTGLHDQANMPGPMPWRGYDPSDIVTYRSVNALPFGGGDLYLLPCSGEDRGESGAGWYVTGTRLSTQLTDLLTCVSRGFQEVYRAGPQTFGNIEPDLTLNEAITSSTQDSCWESRLTNRSMLMSLGIAVDLPVLGRVTRKAHEYIRPSWVTEMALNNGVETVYGNRALNVTKAEFNAETKRFRVAIGRLAIYYLIRGLTAPNGTDLARMEQPNGTPRADLRQLFGTGFGLGIRHSGEYLQDVENGLVAHFEGTAPELWSPAPRNNDACVDDTDCASQPGTFCDAQVVQGDTKVARCVPQETALLRAFRASNTPKWCEVQSWDSLNAARAACQAKGAGSAECLACVQVLLPHLRNACDPSGLDLNPGAGEFDGRAICDLYASAEAALPRREEEFVYLPYAPEGTETPAEASLRAAQQACLDGPQEQVSRVGSTYESTPDEAFHSTLTLLQPGYRHNEITCGREGGEHWDRVTHPASSPSGVVEITFTPTELPGYPFTSPVRDLELALFQGPACTDVITIVSGADAAPTATELQTSWTVVSGVSDEICIRVRPLRPTVQTGHTLRVSRQ